jgi:hypothetical protein
MSKIENILKPLSPEYIGAYLDKGVQLYDIIEWILNYTGPANVVVLTFSLSEEFIRKVYQLKQSGQIKDISVILDFKAIQKTEKIVRLANNIFDNLVYAKTHAKIVLVSNNKYKVCVSGSQNATRGNREESGIVTTDIITFDKFKSEIERIQQNGIYRGDIN